MKHNDIKEINWTLVAMKILRTPSMQKLSPFDIVTGRQLDALEDYLAKNYLSNSITPKGIIEVLKENA